MARRGRNNPGPTPVPPSLPPDRAIDLLRRQRERGQDLLREFSESQYPVWRNTTTGFVQQAFGSDSLNEMEFVGAGLNTQEYVDEEPAVYLRRGLERQVALLDGFIDQLEAVQESRAVNLAVPVAGVPPGRDVFVVHGRDDGPKQAVARFIEHLGLNPVILHEQPDQGRTIVEKLEQHSNVHFAVVLLTPDDRGGPRDSPPESFRPRARQNVLMELGFFLGRLGRKNVRCLHWQGVEVPSDYQGVVFIPFDDGEAWKVRLARELKAVGFNIDLNQVM